MYIIEIKKQAQKYLDKMNEPNLSKILEALRGLALWQGDIEKMKGKKNEYRLKVPKYRIMFTYNKGEIVISVIRINPRGDVYKKGGN